MKANTSLKEKVYQDIIDSIVKGEFKGGQILNEQELVKRYNVSKSPVREALIVLSSQGILTNIPRCGYQVFSFTLQNVSNIMEFRAILEDYLLCQSIGSLQPQHLQQLGKLIPHPSQQRDVWQHWDMNAQFHLKLASYAQNDYIYQQLQQAMAFLKLAYAQFYWSQWSCTSIPDDLAHHQCILECLKSQNLLLARQCLKEDLANFCIQ